MKSIKPLVLVASPRSVAQRRSPQSRPKNRECMGHVALDERFAPLVANLAVNHAPPRSVAAAQAHAMLVRHVLARDTVLVSVAGSVGTPDAVHAFLNALLRLRERMVRAEHHDAVGGQVRRLSEDDLRRMIGDAVESLVVRDVIGHGEVILVHEDGRVGGRRTLSRFRQCIVPLAFHYAESRDVKDDVAPQQPWLAVLSGAPSLPTTDGCGFADALATLDALRAATIDELVGATTRAGSESPEHRAMKALMASWASDLLGVENVAVERRLLPPGAPLQVVTGRPPPPRPGAATVIPDLRLSTDRGEILVEIETFRGLGGVEADAHLAFEQKLRARLEAARALGAAEVWVVVPPDVAVLAAGPLHEATMRLGTCGPVLLHMFTVDYLARTPVQLDMTARSVAVVLPPRSCPEAKEPESSIPRMTLADVVGSSAAKAILHDEIVHTRSNRARSRLGMPAARSALLYGLPGCGKSHLARAIAGELRLPFEHVVASDVTSQWLGGGVTKIRQLFERAIAAAPCVLLIDEIDGIAPPRSTSLSMHTDERRQVAELLAQLERIRSVDVVLLATTNYLEGVDSAIRRAGRFDLCVPVLPPTEDDRASILAASLPERARRRLRGASEIDWKGLAAKTPLFTPADLRSVVESAMRSATRRKGKVYSLTTDDLVEAVGRQRRTLTPDMVRAWLDEVADQVDPVSLSQLEAEIRAADRGASRRRVVGFAPTEGQG